MTNNCQGAPWLAYDDNNCSELEGLRADNTVLVELMKKENVTKRFVECILLVNIDECRFFREL